MNRKNYKRRMSLCLAVLMAASTVPNTALATEKVGSPNTIVEQVNAFTEYEGWKLEGTAEKLNVNDFQSVGEGDITVDGEKLTVSKTEGDHFALYSGLTQATNQFRMEADVELGENACSAALIFGAESAEAVGTKWGGANFNLEESEENVIRVFRNGDYTKNAQGTLDFSGKLHMALEVMADGSYTYVLSDENGESVVQKSTLNDWTTGGYIGLLAFKSEVTFSNITLVNDPQQYVETLPQWNIAGETQALDMSQFATRSGGDVTLDDSGKLTVADTGGDHFVIYEGLEKKTNQFRFEADVELADSNAFSGALTFAIASKKTPSIEWGAANFDLKRMGDDTLRVFHAGSDYSGRAKGELDFSQPVHMALEVMADGSYTYIVTDKNDLSVAQTGKAGTIKNWSTGGYIGLLSFQSNIVFSNARLINDNQEIEKLPKTPIDDELGLFRNNLEDLVLDNGTYTISENGLNVKCSGDAFVESTKSNNTNFVYRATAKFEENKGAASLVFRSNNCENIDETRDAYVANINGETGECRLFAFNEGRSFDLANCQSVPLAEDGVYKLTVTMNGLHMVYAVNDTVVGSTADYTTSGVEDRQWGQTNPLQEGYFGLLSWNSNVTYQDVTVNELEQSELPELQGISASAVGGELESQPVYPDEGYVSIIYASHDTQSVEINPTVADGMTYAIDGPDALSDGVNTYTITTTNPKTGAQLAYRLLVCRRLQQEYYNEEYRGQYHYSVQEGWANDPNCMVYFKGVYHFFYQFYYDGTDWGPMHWMHATSTDLIHWEDHTIELYPDEYGTMFNGYVVIDDTNSSGLFETDEGGLVGLATANGQGQNLITVYSEDGFNWKKVEGVTVSWEDDPLNNTAFRDPQIFKYEDTWFMAIAGGPLRIYSSKDLRTWTCESAYSDLNTECPALYRLPVDNQENQYKWVLSYGGREYKVGDFKQVDGNWRFVADEAYEASTGVMNFGKDYYATMYYYNGAYGDNQNPVITSSWMNNWEYCREVDDASGNNIFNGSFCLNMEMSVKYDDVSQKYILIQTPIDDYSVLEKTDTTVEQEITLNADSQKIDLGSVGTSYRMDIHLDAAEITQGKVTYAVRTDDENETRIIYDYETNEITLDRASSGAIANPKFAELMNSKNMGTGVKNADGSIDLTVYVDRASVELVNGDCSVTAAAQIFPTNGTKADGASVRAEELNGEIKGSITITQMSSIYEKAHEHQYKLTSTTPATCTQDGVETYTCEVCGDVQTAVIPATKNLNDGCTINLSASTKTYSGYPIKPSVTVSDGSIVLDPSSYSVTYSNNVKAGTATVTVTGKNGYTGEISTNFTIEAKSISRMMAFLSYSKCTDNGSPRKPYVILGDGWKALRLGTDYTVTYSNNDTVGKATATITGKGNYTGTLEKNFVINPKTTKLTSVENVSGKKLKVSWEKTSDVTGYQVQYSTLSGFNNKVTNTVDSQEKTSETWSGLSRNKTYYVRVRTYKVVDGVNYYSNWSASKKIRITK